MRITTPKFLNPTRTALRHINKKRSTVMKMKWMTLATLAVALSPSLALAAAPVKQTKTTGTGHANQYHDRTPHIHERGSIPTR